MEEITSVAPISDSVTILFKTYNEDFIQYFDPLFCGWHLNYATYNNIETPDSKYQSIHGLAGLLAYCPEDFAQIEDDYVVVPTMFCPSCRNRMEAYTNDLPKFQKFDVCSVRYRCRLCAKEYKFSNVDQ